ncbi:hypothetical protein AMR47_02265 [Leptospira interrogans]|nr:hypothetical protein AMR47_02265 [Leptospira interrogans]
MSEETQEKKNKKINKMTVAEINAAILTSKVKMNGSSSKYILHLNARLEELAVKGKKLFHSGPSVFDGLIPARF